MTRSKASEVHCLPDFNKADELIVSHNKLGLQDTQVSQGMLLSRPMGSTGLRFQSQTKPKEWHMLPDGTYATTARQPQAEQQHCNFSTHQPGTAWITTLLWYTEIKSICLQSCTHHFFSQDILLLVYHSINLSLKASFMTFTKRPQHPWLQLYFTCSATTTLPPTLQTKLAILPFTWWRWTTRNHSLFTFTISDGFYRLLLYFTLAILFHSLRNLVSLKIPGRKTTQ